MPYDSTMGPPQPDPLTRQLAQRNMQQQSQQDDPYMASLLKLLEEGPQQAAPPSERDRQKQGLALTMMLTGKGRSMGDVGGQLYGQQEAEKQRAQKRAEQEQQRKIAAAQFGYQQNVRGQEKAEAMDFRRQQQEDLQAQREAQNELRRLTAEGTRANQDLLAEDRRRATEQKNRAEQDAYLKSYNTGQEMLSTLDTMISHPARKQATGGSEWMQEMPLSGAREYKAMLDQVRGKAFLTAFETLKGGGQITEVEGKKATDAIARLNTPFLSEEAHLRALQDLRAVAERVTRSAAYRAEQLGAPQALIPQGAQQNQGQPQPQQEGPRPAAKWFGD